MSRPLMGITAKQFSGRGQLESPRKHVSPTHSQWYGPLCSRHSVVCLLYFTINGRNSALQEHESRAWGCWWWCYVMLLLRWISTVSQLSWELKRKLVQRLPLLCNCRVITLLPWFGDGNLKCQLSSCCHLPSWARTGGVYPKSLRIVRPGQTCATANIQRSSHLSGPNGRSCLTSWQTRVLGTTAPNFVYLQVERHESLHPQ